MLIDLHNHTSRCNHAIGTIDQYIEVAISKGIDVYGFSEHAPMDFDPKYRLGFSEMDIYTQEILAAKKRYASDIDIRVGYEVDWLPGHMDGRVLEADVDYLIGSVHFLDKWSFDNPEFIGGWKSRDIDEIWQAYFEAIGEMVRSGLFDTVGHFDLIKVFKYMPNADIVEIAKDTLVTIKNSGMALEINSAGLRKPVGEIYPSTELLMEAYRLDIPIAFGCDAHAPDQVGAGLEQIYSIAKSVGYTKAVTFSNRTKEMVNI